MKLDIEQYHLIIFISNRMLSYRSGGAANDYIFKDI